MNKKQAQHAPDELRIKLTLYITHDFLMELLSYGDNRSLIDEMKRTAAGMLMVYGG
jgi:hypothetical protein